MTVRRALTVAYKASLAVVQCSCIATLNTVLGCPIVLDQHSLADEQRAKPVSCQLCMRLQHGLDRSGADSGHCAQHVKWSPVIGMDVCAACRPGALLVPGGSRSLCWLKACWSKIRNQALSTPSHKSSGAGSRHTMESCATAPHAVHHKTS